MPNSLCVYCFHSQLQFLFLKAEVDFPIELKEVLKGRFWRFYCLLSVKNRNAASLNFDMNELKIKYLINLNICSSVFWLDWHALVRGQSWLYIFGYSYIMNLSLELRWQGFLLEMTEWLKVKESPLAMNADLSTFFFKIIIKSLTMLLLKSVVAKKGPKPSLFSSCKMLFGLRIKDVWKALHWNLYRCQGCSLPLSSCALFLHACSQVASKAWNTEGWVVGLGLLRGTEFL